MKELRIHLDIQIRPSPPPITHAELLKHSREVASVHPHKLALRCLSPREKRCHREVIASCLLQAAAVWSFVSCFMPASEATHCLPGSQHSSESSQHIAQQRVQPKTKQKPENQTLASGLTTRMLIIKWVNLGRKHIVSQDTFWSLLPSATSLWYPVSSPDRRRSSPKQQVPTHAARTEFEASQRAWIKGPSWEPLH